MRLQIITLMFFVPAILPGADDAVRHEFACIDNSGGTVAIVDAGGAITWRCNTKGGRDVWVLPNGNVLFSTGNGAKEVDRTGKEVFSYSADREVGGCQRLPDGGTLVSVCGPAKGGGPPTLVEVGADGTVRHEISLTTTNKNAHLHLRIARRTPAGTYVVAQTGDKAICEYDGQGKVLRRIAVAGEPHGVVPLPDGHFLVSANKGPDGSAILEYDGGGTLVWSVTSNDLPGIRLLWISGLQRLANGNTVICNWLGHGNDFKEAKGLHLIEVTRDKKVVWTFTDQQRFKTISAVHILDQGGAGAVLLR